MNLYIRIFLVSLLAVLSLTSPTSAQNENEFQQTVQIGRGHIQSLNWHSNSSLLVANSVTGAWVYNDELETIIHLSDVTLATFSPAGGLLAGVNLQNQLVIWDDQDFEVVHTLIELEQEIVHIAWSPDGSFLAGADRGGNLVVWDTTEWQPYFEYAAGTSYEGYRDAPFAWSPEGLQLAIQATEQVMIWSTKTLAFTATVEGGGELIWRNEHQLFTASYGGDDYTRATLWNIETGKPQVQYQMGGYWFVLSPDTNLAAATWGSVDVVDVATGETAFEFDPGNCESALAWKPDSTWLAVGEGGFSADVIGTIQVFDTETGKIVDSINGLVGSSAPEKLLWSPDGKKLAAVGWLYGELAIWHVNSSDQLEILFDHSMADTPMIWNPDGRQVLTADGSGSVHVWDSQTGEPIGTLTGHVMPVHDILWQPNGQILATSDGIKARYFDTSRRESVRIWDMQSGNWPDKPLQVLFHDIPLSGLAWNRQGSELAMINEQGSAWIWDSTKRQIVREFPLDLYEGWIIRGIGWDFDGTMLIVPFIDSGHMRMAARDAITGTLPSMAGEWAYHDIPPSDLPAKHWMSDNSLIVAFWLNYDDEGNWRPNSALKLRANYSNSEEWPADFSLKCSPMTGQGKDVAFSPDGQRIAGLDEFGTLMIWDTHSGENMLTVNITGDFSIGGQILWSPDSNLFAIMGGKQHTIRIFDAHSGALVATLQPRNQRTYSPTWSPDSRRIAVVGDGIVTIWTR